MDLRVPLRVLRDARAGILVVVVMVFLSSGARGASLARPSRSPSEAWQASVCEAGPLQDLDGLLCNVTDTASSLSRYVTQVKHQYIVERFQNTDIGEYLDFNLPGLPVENLTYSNNHSSPLAKEDIRTTFQNLLYFQVYVDQAVHDEALQTQVTKDYTVLYSHIKREGLQHLLCILKMAADKIGLEVVEKLSPDDPMGGPVRLISNAMYRNYRDFRLLSDLNNYLDHIVGKFSSPVSEDLCEDCGHNEAQ
jgi:hypothetical protein